MPLLRRSITFANTFPASLLTIQECALPSQLPVTAAAAGAGGAAAPSAAAAAATAPLTGVNARLRQQGLELCVWVFKHAGKHQLKAMGPVALQVGGTKQCVKVQISEESAQTGVEQDVFYKTPRVMRARVYVRAGHAGTDGAGFRHGGRWRDWWTGAYAPHPRSVVFCNLFVKWLGLRPRTPAPQGLLDTLDATAAAAHSDTSLMNLRGFAYQVGTRSRQQPGAH